MHVLIKNIFCSFNSQPQFTDRPIGTSIMKTSFLPSQYLQVRTANAYTMLGVIYLFGLHTVQPKRNARAI